MLEAGFEDVVDCEAGGAVEDWWWLEWRVRLVERKDAYVVGQDPLSAERRQYGSCCCWSRVLTPRYSPVTPSFFTTSIAVPTLPNRGEDFCEACIRTLTSSSFRHSLSSLADPGS